MACTHHCVVAFLVSCLALTLAVQESHRHAPHKTGHFSDGIHNPVFDREALLGSHKMEDLADLPDDVRIKRLRNLAKSHDANNNDIIDMEELQEWVRQSFRMLDREEAMEKLEEEDENSDGKVEFKELLNKAYGYTPEEFETMNQGHIEEDETDVYQEDRKQSPELILDDKARFDAADLDKDGALNNSEYLAFFQPNDYPHMVDVEMAKAVKDFDKNKDGFVSFEEFSGDAVQGDAEERLASRTNFDEYDKNEDGRLSLEELKAYVLPDNNEAAKDEADHLVNVCDLNKDGQLSIDEIVTKEDEFMSSTATDYGRSLHFVRDEL